MTWSLFVSVALGSEVDSTRRADDTLSIYEGRTIDSISVEPRNIYDQSEPGNRRKLFRLANSLHVVTRKKIIRQEVLFQVGDQYSTRLAEEIGRNLRSSQALNDAWVVPEELQDGRLLVRVVTVDRWSLVGGVQVRREGNQTNYQFGFEERNLLGYHQLLHFDYFVQEEEDNYVTGRFGDRRLWGYPLSLELSYSGNPVGSSTWTSLSHPYYDLSQHWTYSFLHAFTGGRSDYYYDTVRVASTNLNGDFLGLSGEYRWGPAERKFAVGAEYQYVYMTYYDDLILQAQLKDSIRLPEDSTYHKVGGIFEFSSLSFVRARRLNGMSYLEDLTLGFSTRFDFARAYGPRFREYAFDDLQLSAEYAAKAGGSVVQAAFARRYVLRETAKLRQGDQFTVKYYNNDLPFVTLVVRSLYNSIAMSDGSNQLYLGGNNGLRGYDKYYRTGDRLHVVNTELRFFPQIEFLSIIIGGAVFADVGRTWKHGDSLRLFDRYHRSIGAGLRLSLEKISRGELIRFDVAHSQDGTWQISADSHQYF